MQASVEVVDVEVKVTSMQGTHIFKRDRMTQLIRGVPWTTKLHLHPNIIKKMKAFLEVENKMGPIIPAPVSQFRPHFQKPILTSGKVIPWKREGGLTENKVQASHPQSHRGMPSLIANCSHPQSYHSMPSLSTNCTKTY